MYVPIALPCTTENGSKLIWPFVQARKDGGIKLSGGVRSDETISSLLKKLRRSPYSQYGSNILKDVCKNCGSETKTFALNVVLSKI
jgi:hypothetical protein